MSLASLRPVRLLKRTFGVRPVTEVRNYKRYSCALNAYLTLKGQQYEVKGVILDISRKGALFRPRSRFMMKLQKVPVELHIGKFEMHGEVVNTIARGYGLEFQELIDEALVAELCQVT